MKSRKVKQKVKKPACRKHPGYDFEVTPIGLKRTCKVCGLSITEAKKEVTLATYRKGKEVNGKGMGNLNV